MWTVPNLNIESFDIFDLSKLGMFDDCGFIGSSRNFASECCVSITFIGNVSSCPFPVILVSTKHPYIVFVSFPINEGTSIARTRKIYQLQSHLVRNDPIQQSLTATHPKKEAGWDQDQGKLKRCSPIQKKPLNHKQNYLFQRLCLSTRDLILWQNSVTAV